MKIGKRLLSLLLCFVMLVGLMPTTVFAAPTNIETSGDWNASSLPDNASLTLTGDLNLHMDTDKTLSYIDLGSGTYKLKVSGSGTLTVISEGTAIKGNSGSVTSFSNMVVRSTAQNGDTYAIDVPGFTFYAVSLVVEGQQGIKSQELNIQDSNTASIIARNGIAINAQDVTVTSDAAYIEGTSYGIYCYGYSYNDAVRLSGNIDIKATNYGIHTATNKAELWSNCKYLSIDANTAICCDVMHLDRGYYLFSGSTQAVIFDSFDLTYYPESNLQIISPNNGSVSGTTIVDSEGDPAKIVRIYAPITEEVNVNVTAPVKGATPQTTSFTGDIPEHCSVKTAVWYENGTQMANNDTFKGGKSYSVELTLETTDNYTFIYNIAGKINGVDANPQMSNNNSTMVLTADMGTLPDEIDLVDLSVAVPVAGAAPAKPTTNTDFTSIYAYEWKLNGNTLGYGENFEGGQTYQLVVRATTTKKFADNVVVKINGVTANVLSVDNNAGVLFESYFAIPMGDNYTVTFDANGGSGNMAPVNNVSGSYTLPDCTFTAPSGKHFKAWDVGGNEKAVGATISVTENTTVTAVWEDDIVLSQEIDSASATITAPVAGNTPSYVITPADSDKYTVSVNLWYINEGNYDTLQPTDTYVAGKSYALRVTFSAKAGYCFADSASFKINGVSAHKYGSVGDVEVIFAVPAAQPNEYIVSYNANGGSGTMVGDMVEENGKFTLENCTYIAPEGYQFKAWAIGSVNGEQKQPGEQITITAETYIYAIWEAVEYNVTVTGGTASVGAGTPITKATMGTTVTLIAGQAPSGQMFDKWVVNGVVVDDANSATTTFVMPAGNVTAEATYKDIPVVTYTVTFDANGGTGSMADATGVSGDYVLPVCGFTAPNGKQFKAWSVGGVEKAAGAIITVNANTTVTAVWENIPVTYYTVTFDSVGGSAVTAQTIEEGQKATKPADPTKSGYDFKGWTLNGSAYDFNSAVNGDITLVATWEQQQVVPTTYTVTFDSNGGSAVTAQTIEAGQKATKPADPTKAGYDFKGWTLNGSAYDFNTAVNGDITLVATWEQQPTGHTHDYGQEPNKWDATHHWKECTDQACPDLAGSIKDKAPHADSDGNGRCDDCNVDLIKISFAPGEGTGTMAAVYVTLLPGSVSYDFTLPANGFTAPSGKSFKCWSVGGSEKAVGAVIPVAANTTVTAVWAGNTYNPRPNYPIYINPTPGSSSTGQIIAAKTFDGGIGLSVAVTILSAMGGAWLAKKKED